MNEFIVWDEKKKMFYDVIEVNYENFDNTLRYVKGNNGKRLYVSHDDFTIFSYIDKTDIDDNKIYADCSVVEFEVVKENKYFHEISRKSYRGYFAFNKIRLQIALMCDKEKKVFLFGRDNIQNLKVIGTLQEDKHLLGEVK